MKLFKRYAEFIVYQAYNTGTAKFQNVQLYGAQYIVDAIMYVCT